MHGSQCMCERPCSSGPAGWSVVSGVAGAACIGGAGIAQGKAAGNVASASSTILHARSPPSAESLLAMTWQPDPGVLR